MYSITLTVIIDFNPNLYASVCLFEGNATKNAFWAATALGR